MALRPTPNGGCHFSAKLCGGTAHAQRYVMEEITIECLNTLFTDNSKKETYELQTSNSF